MDYNFRYRPKPELRTRLDRFAMLSYLRLPWLRIVAEGSAIVVSILLAFAIDAWWERQNQLEQAQALISGLREDFTASQAHIGQWLRGNQKILQTLKEFQREIAGATDDAPLTVPLEWLVAAVGAPTYSPTDARLQMAISSGQIELIEDVALRAKLAEWRQQIDDTREDELLIREIVVHHLVPALSEQVRLERAFDFNLIVGWFLDDPGLDLNGKVELRTDKTLEGALSERIFYTGFVVEGLATVQATQSEILQLLEH